MGFWVFYVTILRNYYKITSDLNLYLYEYNKYSMVLRNVSLTKRIWYVYETFFISVSNDTVRNVSHTRSKRYVSDTPPKRFPYASLAIRIRYASETSHTYPKRYVSETFPKRAATSLYKLVILWDFQVGRERIKLNCCRKICALLFDIDKICPNSFS